ncbi:MAG: OsmC family protein [Flavobacteriaceae bacterium]|nr:OsmC family protein [Flavobacteriaceae bacterium]
MEEEHKFKASIIWTGNKGQGTVDSNAYDRSHTITVENKPDILCSVDPAFRGDKTKYNPEDLFVASLSACHMLWYLYLCSEVGVIVVDYKDNAIGTMKINADGNGHFTEITLNPIVTVTNKAMIAKANKLHHKANKMCFIANSCNFPVRHNSTCKVEIK